MNFPRRDFLKYSAQTGLFLSLQSAFAPRAWAAEPNSPPWFFVQVHMKEGWDVTLGTDPWLGAKPDEKEMFIEYEPANLERVGNITFGPSMQGMKPFASQMTLVNGIFMSSVDNGHEAAGLYMMSGSTNQSWGCLPVEVLENRESQLLGILNQGSPHTGYRAPSMTDISSLKDLVSQDSGGGEGFESSENSRNRLSRLEKELAGSQLQLSEMKRLLTTYKDPLKPTHYLAAGMAAGLSKVAFYEIINRLDSHNAHPGVHLSEQKKSWDDFAELLGIFKKTPLAQGGLSLFDQTTFFVTSEFARSAALNSAQGKDHNPLTNSVLMMGPQIRGNQVIGGSHLVTARESQNGQSYHIASPIDFQTGRPLGAKTNATILRPENLVATAVEALGISRRRFAAVDPAVPSLWSLIKK